MSSLIIVDFDLTVAKDSLKAILPDIKIKKQTASSKQEEVFWRRLHRFVECSYKWIKRAKKDLESD